MTEPDTSGHDADLHTASRCVKALALALARWAGRDDTKPQADIRQAANHAMDNIDVAIAALHRMRARLTGEIRASDDAAAARVDRLLGK